jgi:hypothetical protein
VNDVVNLQEYRKRRRQLIGGPRPDASRPDGVHAVAGSMVDGPVVCTACGARFVAKARQFSIAGDEVEWKADAIAPDHGLWGLDDHLAMSPECRRDLTRPVGMFGAGPLQPNQHCPACHDSRARCSVHYDACPVCR